MQASTSTMGALPLFADTIYLEDAEPKSLIF